MINLECKTQSQNSERINTFSMLLGTETKKAVQILKKGQSDLIIVLRINKTTLEIEYAKYMELVEPILCVKL